MLEAHKVDSRPGLVTEDVWEEVSDDDTPAPVALLSVKEEAIKNASGHYPPNQYQSQAAAPVHSLTPPRWVRCSEATASTARKKSTTQGNIMNFFGKK